MILTINGGSSSIKFSLYQQGSSFKKVFSGQISRIGLPEAEFTSTDVKKAQKQTLPIKANDYPSTIAWLIEQLEKQTEFNLITAIGHRVVHGMQHTQPERITT